MSRIVAISLASTAFASCATHEWVGPPGGVTEQQVRADAWACQQQALSMYPQRIVQTPIGTGYQQPSETRCQSWGSQLNCTTTPGQYVPPEYIASDANDGPRKEAIKSCLFAKGYRLQRK